jgi:hypothetical protein
MSEMKVKVYFTAQIAEKDLFIILKETLFVK